MAMAAAAAKKEVKVQIVCVEVPFVESDSYASRRVDVTLNDKQARRLRSLLDALNQTDARLESGKHVETSQHAIQYLLENLQPKNNTDDTVKNQKP